MDDDFDDSLDDALYNQWLNFSSSGQWDRARGVLGKLLTRDPDAAWLHTQMGHTLYQLGEYKDAEVHFKRSIVLDPDEAEPFQGLTYLYLAMNRAGVAEDHCRKALQLDPDDIDNWILMVHLCVHFEDLLQARQCLARAEAIAPRDTRLIALRTEVGAIEKGAAKLTPKQQIEGYEKILRQQPENESAHYNIGRLKLYETKDYQGAEASFRRALAIDPADKSNQKALIAALRKRDPVLKVLWSPFNFGMGIMTLYAKLWDMKWPIIFLIFTWEPLLIGGVALWLVFYVLFWPMAKAYEALTLVEVNKKMGRITIYRGPMARLHRLPFAARIGIFAAIFAAFWGTISFLYFKGGHQDKILNWTASIVVGGVILLIVFGLVLWLRDEIRNIGRRKKNAQIPTGTPPSISQAGVPTPPPLPTTSPILPTAKDERKDD